MAQRKTIEENSFELCSDNGAAQLRGTYQQQQETKLASRMYHVLLENCRSEGREWLLEPEEPHID